MNRVTVDPETRTRLQNLDKELEIYDEAGTKLGIFLPTDPDEAAIYEWARNEFTDEEIDAARSEKGRVTTQELLEGLKD